MPRPKQMIKRSIVEVAKARRICKFTSESITKGSVCLVVYDGSRDRSCYSRDVGLDMIRLARMRLDKLEEELSEDRDC